MVGLVIGRDGFAGDGTGGWGFVIEVVNARGGLLQELSGAVAEEFVDSDLHFECCVAIFLVDF